MRNVAKKSGPTFYLGCYLLSKKLAKECFVNLEAPFLFGIWYDVIKLLGGSARTSL